MKRTTHDNYRVSVSGTVQLPPISGAKDVGLPISGAVIYPQRLGDFGGVSMSDSLASRDIPGDYRRRCEDIVTDLRRQHPWLKAEIVCDTREECSHCGYEWEVVTAEHAARWPDDNAVVGEPACCEKAQAEFHAEKETVR